MEEEELIPQTDGDHDAWIDIENIDESLVTVSVQTDSGQLVSVKTNFTSPPPCPTNCPLSKQRRKNLLS